MGNIPYESLEEVEAKLHKVMSQGSVKERDGQMEEIKANIGVEENSTETKEISIENKTTEQLQSENEQLRKDSQRKDKQLAELRSLNKQLLDTERKAREISERWLITSVFILIPSVFLISTLLRSWVIGVLGYLILGSLIFTSNNLAHKYLERKEEKEKSKHHRTT